MRLLIADGKPSRAPPSLPYGLLIYSILWLLLTTLALYLLSLAVSLGHTCLSKDDEFTL
jgi:hypothetical protein